MVMASKEEQKQAESKKSETGSGAEADTDEMLLELQDLLHKLKESQLQGVFDFLSITCPEGKSRYGMLKLLINYITSSAFEESEDGGMSEYFALKANLNKYREIHYNIG